MTYIKHLVCVVAVVSFICTVDVWATGRISRIRAGSGKVDLTVETTPGERYQLQYRAGLVDGEWTNVGSEFVAVAATTVRNVIAREQSGVFRVVIIKSGSFEDPDNPDSPPPLPPPLPPPSE